jgi:hypothetical protein
MRPDVVLRRPLVRVAVPLVLLGGIATSVVAAYRGYVELESPQALAPAEALAGRVQPGVAPAPGAGAAVTAAGTRGRPHPETFGALASPGARPAIATAPYFPTMGIGPAVPPPPFAPPWATLSPTGAGGQATRGAMPAPAWSPAPVRPASVQTRSGAPWREPPGGSPKSCRVGFGFG